MAGATVYRITVKAPQAKVFDYLADVARHGEWGMDDMKVVSEQAGAPAVGSRYRAEGLLMGKVHPSVVTITDHEPPRRFAIDAEDSNSVFHHEFIFSGNGDTTQVERRVSMSKGPWYNPIMMSVFRGTISKAYDGALEKAKIKLEAAG